LKRRRGAQPASIAARIVLAAGLAVLATGSAVTPAFAQARAPGYARVAALLPELWKARYPVAVQEFLPNPENRGVYAASDGGRTVYYYHFIAVTPRPFRADDESLQSEAPRRVELWVRYRSWLAEPYDFSFARRDLLPGTNKRWVRL
jgi:hypothetical protein